MIKQYNEYLTEFFNHQANKAFSLPNRQKASKILTESKNFAMSELLKDLEKQVEEVNTAYITVNSLQVLHDTGNMIKTEEQEN